MSISLLFNCNLLATLNWTLCDLHCSFWDILMNMCQFFVSFFESMLNCRNRWRTVRWVKQAQKSINTYMQSCICKCTSQRKYMFNYLSCILRYIHSFIQIDIDRFRLENWGPGSLPRCCRYHQGFNQKCWRIQSVGVRTPVSHLLRPFIGGYNQL